MAAAKSDPDAQPTDLDFWKDANVVLPESRQASPYESTGMH